MKSTVLDENQKIVIKQLKENSEEALLILWIKEQKLDREKICQFSEFVSNFNSAREIFKALNDVLQQITNDASIEEVTTRLEKFTRTLHDFKIPMQMDSILGSIAEIKNLPEMPKKVSHTTDVGRKSKKGDKKQNYIATLSPEEKYKESLKNWEGQKVHVLNNIKIKVEATENELTQHFMTIPESYAHYFSKLYLQNIEKSKLLEDLVRLFERQWAREILKKIPKENYLTLGGNTEVESKEKIREEYRLSIPADEAVALQPKLESWSDKLLEALIELEGKKADVSAVVTYPGLSSSEISSPPTTTAAPERMITSAGINASELKNPVTDLSRLPNELCFYDREYRVVKLYAELLLEEHFLESMRMDIEKCNEGDINILKKFIKEPGRYEIKLIFAENINKPSEKEIFVIKGNPSRYRILHSGKMVESTLDNQIEVDIHKEVNRARIFECLFSKGHIENQSGYYQLPIFKGKRNYSIYGNYISDSKHTALEKFVKEKIETLLPKNSLSDLIDKIGQLDEIKNTFDAERKQRPELEKNIKHLITLLLTIKYPLKIPQQLEKKQITISFLRIPGKELLQGRLTEIEKHLSKSHLEVSNLGKLITDESKDLIKCKLIENLTEYFYEKIYTLEENKITDLLFCVRKGDTADFIGQKLGLEKADREGFFAFIANYVGKSFKDIFTVEWIEYIVIVKCLDRLITDKSYTSWKKLSDMSNNLKILIHQSINREIDINEIKKFSGRIKLRVSELYISLFKETIDKLPTQEKKLEVINRCFTCSYNKFLKIFTENSDFVYLIDEKVFEEKIKSPAQRLIASLKAPTEEKTSIQENDKKSNVNSLTCIMKDNKNKIEESQRLSPEKQRIKISLERWYSDWEINEYTNLIIKNELSGYKNHSSFLLNGQKQGCFPDETDKKDYFLFVTPAIDIGASAGPITQWFDKMQQPEPKAKDDRCDVLDELLFIFKNHTNCNAKIVFPYNQTQLHWLTGEIQIHKTNDSYHIIATAHNPYGAGALKNPEAFQEIIKKRILNENPNAKINFEFLQSPYTPRQARGDAVSCGVIVAHEIIQRILGKNLNQSEPYPVGVRALREKIHLAFETYLPENDLTRQRFIQREGRLSTLAKERKKDREPLDSNLTDLLVQLENTALKTHLIQVLGDQDTLKADYLVYATKVSTALLQYPLVLHSEGEVLSESDQAILNQLANQLCDASGQLRNDRDWEALIGQLQLNQTITEKEALKPIPTGTAAAYQEVFSTVSSPKDLGPSTPKVSPSLSEAEQRETAFLRAAERGDYGKVKHWLQDNVNVNAKTQDKAQATALHFAAKFGSQDLVELLLKHGADIQEKDSQGKTALDWSREFLQENITRLLETRSQLHQYQQKKHF